MLKTMKKLCYSYINQPVVHETKQIIDTYSCQISFTIDLNNMVLNKLGIFE